MGCFTLSLCLSQMHKSYKNIVHKAKSIVQDKAEKQAMLEELRKKAQESSRLGTTCFSIHKFQISVYYLYLERLWQVATSCTMTCSLIIAT